MRWRAGFYVVGVCNETGVLSFAVPLGQFLGIVFFFFQSPCFISVFVFQRLSSSGTSVTAN